MAGMMARVSPGLVASSVHGTWYRRRGSAYTDHSGNIYSLPSLEFINAYITTIAAEANSRFQFF
jgi:hypothetical protein